MAFDDLITYDGAIVGTDEGSPNLGNSFYIQFGTAAGRMAAGNKGILYFATDTKVLSYDDGAAWQTIGSVVELTTADDLMTHDGTAPKRLQNAFSKTAAPGATDDSAAGYAVGSVWIDTTNDRAYVCLDATATAAVWKEITPLVRTTVVTASRTAAAGAGAQAITGAGFAPKGAIVTADLNNDGVGWSIGFGDDANGQVELRQSVNQAAGKTMSDSTYIVGIGTSDWVGDYMRAPLTSLDADGLTITWQKGSSGMDVNLTIKFFG